MADAFSKGRQSSQRLGTLRHARSLHLPVNGLVRATIRATNLARIRSDALSPLGLVRGRQRVHTAFQRRQLALHVRQDQVA